MTIVTDSEITPNASIDDIQIQPKSQSTPKITSFFHSFKQSFSWETKGDKPSFSRSLSAPTLSPRTQKRVENAQIIATWKESLFSEANKLCEEIYESAYKNVTFCSLEDVETIAKEMFTSVHKDLTKGSLGLSPILEKIQYFHNNLPYDSELKEVLRPLADLEETNPALLCKFNLRLHSITQSSPHLKDQIEEFICLEEFSERAHILKSNKLKEELLINIKVWLLSQINACEIDWTVDSLTPETENGFHYSWNQTKDKLDLRLLYPSDVLRGLISDSKAIHPNTIKILYQDVFDSDIITYDQESDLHKLKATHKKKYILRPIIRQLSEALREKPLRIIPAHLLINKYIELQEKPATHNEQTIVDKFFDERKASYKLDSDPDTREVEINEINRRILYELRATPFFSENPEFACLGLLSIDAFGPVRYLQRQHFPLTCLSHHSLDETGFITRPNKEYGTNLHVTATKDSDNKTSLSVTQQKEFFMDYTNTRKAKQGSSSDELAPVTFSVRWKLKIPEMLDNPLQGVATFHDIRTHKELPIEEKQRIVRIFLNNN
jgi:hypothetical protein